MIHIQSWICNIANKVDQISSSKKYAATFTFHSKYDDRGDWVQQYINTVSEKIIPVSYNPYNASLTIDSKTYGITQLNDYPLPIGNILIDATSLALPELLHLFEILNNNKSSFDVIYVQPTEYSTPRNSYNKF